MAMKNSHISKPSTTAQGTLITALSPESESITALSQQAELCKLRRIITRLQQQTSSTSTTRESGSITGLTLSALLIVDRDRSGRKNSDFKLIMSILTSGYIYILRYLHTDT